MQRQCERLSNTRYCAKVLLSLTTECFAPVNMQGPPCHSVHAHTDAKKRKRKKYLTHTERKQNGLLSRQVSGKRLATSFPVKQLKTGWSSVIRVHVEHLVPLAIMADEHIDSQPNFSGVDNMEVSHSCMLFFLFLIPARCFHTVL